MTIRLKCAECQRNLKVPDEALGKKVQCPACGARFIGHIDSSPPTAPVPDFGLEESSALEPIAEEPFGSDDAAMDVTEAVDEGDADEVIPEIVEEHEPVAKSKNRSKEKKSRRSLGIGLAVVVLLLVGGLGAYFAYLYLF
jgi:DNA-directed RNA polymerase subunit RPC12/RpoP